MSKKKIEPDVRLVFRMPPDIHQRAAAVAAELDRSLNNFILHALNNELKRGEWLDRSIDDGK